MKKHSGILCFYIFFSISAILNGRVRCFSQSRVVINNGGYMVMNGGTSTTPVYLVVDNGNANAIIRNTSGHIISENEYNILKWNIGTNIGDYYFHFGVSSTYIPFRMNINPAGTGSGSISVATWYTLNNATLPSGVSNMNPSENSAVDRFWVIALNGYSANPTADVYFYYNAAELDGIPEADLQAQRYNGLWESPVGTVNTINDYVLVSGIADFSPWTLGNKNNPLPVGLLFFNAYFKNRTTVITEWVTATEINNDYFAVERSVDGIDFEQAGTVRGAGNSSNIRNYKFTDEFQFPTSNLKSQFLYYRLRQVDFDGTFSYSEIVPVFAGNMDDEIKMFFPNPARDYLNITFTAVQNTSVNIELFNICGDKVYMQTISPEKVNTAIRVPIDRWAQSIYTLRVIMPGRIFQKQIIIL